MSQRSRSYAPLQESPWTRRRGLRRTTWKGSDTVHIQGRLERPRRLLHRVATQRPSPRSDRLCRCQQARRTCLRACEADEPGPGRSLRLPRPSRPAHRERRSPAQGPERVPGPLPPSGAWQPLGQTPHRRLHQTRRDARARHMRGRPDRTPQARATARLAMCRRSSPNLRSQNSSPALGKSTMSDRLHHHREAISPPLQARRKHGTDARPLVGHALLQFFEEVED